ncbi:uncharacterized protein LOC106078079 isoform X3 [Biomphalaria glabrata]|uniref:Uncharacterized protein LOC106078079 isoform X3 n=1 Tax=Biomphalaria glabrata TaxID=6526 RepID=A0A9W3A4U8_BIOGL|nr:uncharacterized protein LOC106078079 isoform X3 [Biomphalaria glabrata]
MNGFRLVCYITLICSWMMVSLCTTSASAMPSPCSLTFWNKSTSLGSVSLGGLDRRDYVEYYVTYINAFRDDVIFEESNTTRFQPMRWFNVQSNVKSLLQITYIYLFNIFKSVFHIHTEHVEINVTPQDCIYTIDFEILEELTRNLFLDVSGKLTNPHICSAHIDNNDGEGRITFKCCEGDSLTGRKCQVVNETFVWELGLHIISILASSLILLYVYFGVYSRSSIRTEEFTFHPNSVRNISIKRSDEFKSPKDEGNVHDQTSNIEIIKEADEIQSHANPIINFSKVTTDAAKDVIQFVRTLSLMKVTSNNQVLQDNQEQIKTLVEKMKLDHNTLLLEIIEKKNSLDISEISKLKEDYELVIKAFHIVEEAAEMLNNSTKEIQKSHETFTIVKIMEAIRATEASEQAHKDMVEALSDFKNKISNFKQEFMASEDEKREFKEEVLKETKLSALNVRKQFRMAIAKAGQTASFAKETVELLSDLKKGINIVKKNTVLENDTYKLLVFKEKCVDENNLAITFTRCVTEFLTGLKTSFCNKKLKKQKYIKCSCCCCPYRLYLGRILSVLLSSIVLVPLIFIALEYKNNEKADYKILCETYKNKGYTCPFNVQEIPRELTYTVFGVYALFSVLYLILPLNCLTMIVCHLPGCCSKSKQAASNTLKIVFNLLSQFSIYLTWGLSLYTVFYFILSVVVLSSSTKNKLDDLVLTFFPLAVIVYEYIQNVTNKYKVITEKIINLLRTVPEFKCLPSNHSGNEAVLLPGATTNVKARIKNYGCRRRLKVNRPLIFVQTDGHVLISKRLVAMIYNESPSCMFLELSAYLKALMFCIVPALVYTSLLFILITYLSIFSYSKEVAGYVVSAATYLQFVKYKAENFLRDLLIKDSTADPRFIDNFRKQLDSFNESWIVSNERKDVQEIPTGSQQASNTGSIIKRQYMKLRWATNNRYQYRTLRCA